MAGSKLNNYSSTDNNITQMQLTEDASFIGKHNLTLTNMSTTSIPAIAAGSIIECNGALYKFSTEEAISTAGVTSTSGTYYIKVVPTSSQITAAFSTVTPVFRDSLQGWYESTSSNDRYANYLVISSGGSYKKILLNSRYNGSRFVNLISCYVNSITYLASTSLSTITITPYVDIYGEVSSASKLITIAKDGLYEIKSNVTINTEANTAGSDYVQNYIQMYVNSSAKCRGIFRTWAYGSSGNRASLLTSLHTEDIIYLQSGDVINFEASGLGSFAGTYLFSITGSQSSNNPSIFITQVG
jgi:hypothetical protein